MQSQSPNNSEHDAYPSVADLWNRDYGGFPRFLWMIMLSAAIGLCIISCFGLGIQYYSNPTATRIDLKRVAKLELPRVTVCFRWANVLNSTELWHYLDQSFPNETQSTLVDLVTFIVAGSGFRKMRPVWDSDYLQMLNTLYLHMRGNVTVREYFQSFFDRFGIHCQALFGRCTLGGRPVDCCSLFEVSFTIRRGRCFSLKPLEQTLPDEMGKLLIEMHSHSPFGQSDGNAFRSLDQELIAYVGEQRMRDIMPFPRYYIRPQHFCKMRLATRRVLLREDGRQSCTEMAQYYGDGMCYLQKIWQKFSHDLNCTVPYWRNGTKESCEPLLLIKHYQEIVENQVENETSGSSSKISCDLPCNRTNYLVTFEDQDSGNPSYMRWKIPLRLEVSHTRLQFEEVVEVQTITFIGFVSQLGGQLGLFTGTSIISLFQMGLFAAIFCRRKLQQNENNVAIARASQAKSNKINVAPVVYK